MNYKLTSGNDTIQPPFWHTLKQLAGLMTPHKVKFSLAIGVSMLSVGLTLLWPLILAHVIDTFIAGKDFSGVLRWAAILGGIFITAFVLDYIQTSYLGAISQQILFDLRNRIFDKLQQLPLAFFNQNRSGDLISRLNNDTNYLSSFFSESLGWMLSNSIIITGAGIFMLFINWQLGLVALIPAIIIIMATKLTSGWLKSQNAKSLQSTSELSGEIQENLNNFKVIAAFNRQDYFQYKFDQFNQRNYKANLKASVANTTLSPIFDMSANIAQALVLIFGLHLASQDALSIGALIAYMAYVKSFYDPLRELANMWSNFQKALAAWDRVNHLLGLKSDLTTHPDNQLIEHKAGAMIEFKNVSFHYPEGKQVLNDINFTLDHGKTYALVGPTGGGKTTTASLIARLFDPSQGMVLLDNRDIRGYEPKQRAQEIGFILQEPFLFNGTIAENIAYGNAKLQPVDSDQITATLQDLKLYHLIEKFSQGLDTPIQNTGDSLSLGQKQIIAFIRAVVRQPKLLILDEATANVDTITEQVLQEILDRLPSSTTKIIIAHRLNTIEKADQIFFVNSGTITNAGSLKHAMELLMDGRKAS